MTERKRATHYALMDSAFVAAHSAYGGAREAARLRAVWERTEGERAVEQTCENKHDGGLSTSHAIMRGGPGSELSPPAGAIRVPRRLRP